MAGAILGTVLIIPLRKQMIEIDRLRFPTGVAVTTIIRAGKAGVDKAKLLAAGFLISAAWKGLLLTGWLDRLGFIANEEIYFGMGVLPDYVTASAFAFAHVGRGGDAGRARRAAVLSRRRAGMVGNLAGRGQPRLDARGPRRRGVARLHILEHAPPLGHRHTDRRRVDGRGGLLPGHY